MKNFSLLTKAYIYGTMLTGMLLFLGNLRYLNYHIPNLVILVILCVVASLAQIIKVEGQTNRSHYAISFVIYSFTLLQLGLPEAMTIIVCSNLAEWLWHRSPWFIAAFNSSCYIILSNIAFIEYRLLNPSGSVQSWESIIAIVAGMLTFTLLNHLMVGLIIWAARGENFAKSGIFDFLPLIIDLTMLVMGAMLFLIWNYNPFAILLFLIPMYLIYSTLRVPALERQTEQDLKTGLYNHTYFMQQMQNELSRAERFDRPLSVIMCDLDLLRNINNTYGHLAGDEVLKGVAKILQQSVREYDTVARFGGEEFVILMPETVQQFAYERAEQIRCAVEAAQFAIPTSVTPIQATLSLGVAGRERFGQTREEIIHNADTALYHAKIKGRNRTYLYNSGAYFDLMPLVDESAAPAEGAQPAAETPTAGKGASTSTPDSISTPASNSAVAQGSSPAEDYTAAHTVYQANQSDPDTDIPEPISQEKVEADAKTVHRKINLFIGFSFLITMALFGMLLRFELPTAPLGLAFFMIAVIVTEWFSIEIYVHDTAVSTSAAPLVAGILLFGPYGALILALTFALTAYFKNRGPASRILFNFTNQLIPAVIFLAFLQKIQPFQEFSQWVQVIICLGVMALTYFSTTVMVSVGMAISTSSGVRELWGEHFLWLAPYYFVMGLITFALILSYDVAGPLGIFVILAPLMMLRTGQKQYVGRTQAMVLELRAKNTSLEEHSAEIHRLNDGLLETLAEVIDLHDSYVLGHARQVTYYAVRIAQALGLRDKQIELIRKAALLHDVGKIGIPERILEKPSALSREEFTVIKKHTTIGAQLLEKNLSLKTLIDPVKHHHERFDGSGYPDGLAMEQIPIEARIIAVADSIEAMASDRSYRRALGADEIIAELAKNSGSQFDPEIAALAIRLLKSGAISLKRIHL